MASDTHRHLLIMLATVCAALAVGAGALPANLPLAGWILGAVLVSGLYVKQRGGAAELSVSHFFVLICLPELSLQEALGIGCLAATVQCAWASSAEASLRAMLIRIASMSAAVVAVYAVHVSPALALIRQNATATLLVGTLAYSVTSATLPALTIGTRLRALGRVWWGHYSWSFWHHMIGAAVAGLVWGQMLEDLAVSILALPAFYLLYVLFKLNRNRVEAEKRHAQSMEKLQLRTIEALALAIEAKDETTYSHLQRVQFVAVEIGKEMGLTHEQLQALRAAAILHDIGKLAVPENIICKPGKLTAEEFEKIKIHPIVGGEILEAVGFPYPVVPIVRSHHEKWDGTGYPLGLKGEQIPLGARILSVVDCLDALTSDRPYRTALSLDEAIQVVVRESEKSYDPVVVEVLKHRYRELDRAAHSALAGRVKLTTAASGSTAASPAAGLEAGSGRNPATHGPQPRHDFLSAIAAARQEVQSLLELSEDLGSSLSLQETLSVLDHRLHKLISYQALVLCILEDGKLVPTYASGENLALMAACQSKVGQGLIGWVAQHGTPIVNGNPAVEFTGLETSDDLKQMRSALVAPLEGMEQPLGVLALLATKEGSFDREDLRILMAIAPRLSRAVRNALQYRRAEQSAGVDALTDLPNTRSLFLHLDRELARCRRSDEILAVLVCDLDGFKQVNDRFGHLAGNQVLRQVARGFREGCRPYDYVARMGGDEFALVFPGLTPESLSKRLEALTSVVRQAGCDVCGQELLSVSIGVAWFPKHGDNAEDLLANADRRMYKAKWWGKATAFDMGYPTSLDRLAESVR